MNAWVVAIGVIIVAGLAYSYWRQVSYSIVVSVSCGLAFVMLLVSSDSYRVVSSSTMEGLQFMPGDLVDPARVYTVVTSMFAHVSFFHLFFNILGLAFIGTIFEERIGSRPFIILYLLTGLVGTLTFAAVRWNDPYVAVVGASGAISGVLGAFARLYPNERMSMILFLFPLPAMPIWVIVGIFVLIQFVFVSGEANVAVEAHLGGLLAGILLAPIIVKTPLHKRVKRMVSLSALKKLATTPEMKAMMRRIEEEEIPDVRSAWIEHFLASARCPHCGSRLKVSKETVRCEKGHLI